MAYQSETEQLKQRFHELVEKVRDNQAVLERFQNFQLAMLSADDIVVLLETLLHKSIRHFTYYSQWYFKIDHKLSLKIELKLNLIFDDKNQDWFQKLV